MMLTHFAIRILPREGPRDAAALGIAPLLPRRGFSGEKRLGWQAPVKALPIKDSNLDLRQIEPAGVYWGVVKHHAPEQVPCCGDTEHFLEAHAKMGIEVVEDQMTAARVRVDL
ncbi:MAG: hypothetical protein WA900_00775 [Casimicrobiaceae bacterium]